MIVCSVCRHREVEGELFCSECGARLSIDGTDQAGGTAASPPPDPVTSDLLKRLAPGQLALVVGDNAQPIILEGRSEYLLGRDFSSPAAHEIDLNTYGGRESGVSRTHAALRQERHRVVLVDLGSTNGTRLNGSLLKTNLPTVVESGDEIRLGRLRMRINFVP
jgi:hypothetical protein